MEKLKEKEGKEELSTIEEIRIADMEALVESLTKCKQSFGLSYKEMVEAMLEVITEVPVTISEKIRV